MIYSNGIIWAHHLLNVNASVDLTNRSFIKCSTNTNAQHICCPVPLIWRGTSGKLWRGYISLKLNKVFSSYAWCHGFTACLLCVGHLLEIRFKRQLVCKFDITEITQLHFINSPYACAFAYILISRNMVIPFLFFLHVSNTVLFLPKTIVLSFSLSSIFRCNVTYQWTTWATGKSRDHDWLPFLGKWHIGSKLMVYIYIAPLQCVDDVFQMKKKQKQKQTKKQKEKFHILCLIDCDAELSWPRNTICIDMCAYVLFQWPNADIRWAPGERCYVITGDDAASHDKHSRDNYMHISWTFVVVSAANSIFGCFDIFWVWSLQRSINYYSEP